MYLLKKFKVDENEQVMLDLSQQFACDVFQ
jgi:hypothetical protein